MLLWVTPSSAAAVSNVRLANLTQDVELLGRQVAILRSEVENLRRENLQLKAAAAAGASSKSVSRDSLRALAAAIDDKFDSFRRELSSANAVHKQELLKEINAKLTELARQTKIQMEVLAKRSGTPVEPVLTLVDHPKTGVVYKVKKGDTLSRIARDHGSKIAWIKSANNIVKDTSLQVGIDVFVPQNN
jgi:LysM repeat protein